ALEVERRLRERHEGQSIYSVVGQSGGDAAGASTSGNTPPITAPLVPPHDRAPASDQIRAALPHPPAHARPTAKIQIGLPNAFGFGGFGGQPIQVQVQGPDPATVDQLALQVQHVLEQVPGASAVRSSNDNLQTQIRATIDWRRAADLGVTAQ